MVIADAIDIDPHANHFFGYYSLPDCISSCQSATDITLYSTFSISFSGERSLGLMPL